MAKVISLSVDTAAPATIAQYNDEQKTQLAQLLGKEKATPAFLKSAEAKQADAWIADIYTAGAAYVSSGNMLLNAALTAKQRGYDAELTKAFFMSSLQAAGMNEKAARNRASEVGRLMALDVTKAPALVTGSIQTTLNKFKKLADGVIDAAGAPVAPVAPLNLPDVTGAPATPATPAAPAAPKGADTPSFEKSPETLINDGINALMKQTKDPQATALLITMKAQLGIVIDRLTA